MKFLRSLKSIFISKVMKFSIFIINYLKNLTFEYSSGITEVYIFKTSSPVKLKIPVSVRLHLGNKKRDKWWARSLDRGARGKLDQNILLRGELNQKQLLRGELDQNILLRSELNQKSCCEANSTK